MLELIIYNVKYNDTFKLVYTDYYTECSKVKRLLARMIYTDKIKLVDYSCETPWNTDNKIKWLLDMAITILRKD